MATINGIPLNFNEIPLSWRFCFCDGCPKHQDCLRYQSGLHVKVTQGFAIFPPAYQQGDCPHFKRIRVIRAAYGFRSLFSEIKEKDGSELRRKIKYYLGGHGTYYRYNSGEKLLTPEQQQWILNLFAKRGYTEGLSFDHYREMLDFSS